MLENRPWIFFLIIEGKLNPNFFVMAEEFKKNDMELMPVVYQELLDVLKMKQEIHLITCIGSLEGRKAYERSVKTVIEKLMSEQKIVLHQFSSFEADKQQDILKQMNHQFIPLPVKVEEAVQMVKLKMEQWTKHLQGPKKLGAKSSISI
jgi:hypothetical protein